MLPLVLPLTACPGLASGAGVDRGGIASLLEDGPRSPEATPAPFRDVGDFGDWPRPAAGAALLGGDAALLRGAAALLGGDAALLGGAAASLGGDAAFLVGDAAVLGGEATLGGDAAVLGGAADSDTPMSP